MKKIQWLFVSVLLTGQILRAGNNPIPGPVVVSKVTFSGGIKVKNDNDTEMPTTHWVDEVNNGDPNDSWPDGQPDKNDPNTKPNEVKSFAYAYTSESEPTVGAVFKWKGEPPEEGKPYSAEGEVIDTPNCKFKLEKKDLDEETSTIYPDTKSLQKIVHERRIQAYLTSNRKVARVDGNKSDRAADIPPLKIKWTVRNAQGDSIGVSYSTHTIYVTWDAPVTDFRQETLFNLSCVMLNNDPEPVVATVKLYTFQEFEDQSVFRMDRELLHYYEDFNVENVTTDSLLDDSDGQCGAWVNFFIDCGKILGFDEEGEIHEYESINEEKILIKEWKFKDNPSLPEADYPYINVRSEKLPVKGKNSYNYIYSDVIDEEGIMGQSNPNPHSMFDIHYVASGPVLYDPSYGKKYTSMAELESQIAGFVVIADLELDEEEFNFDLNEDGDISGIQSVVCYAFKKNKEPEVNLRKSDQFDY